MEACFYSDKFHQAEVLQQPSLSWMVCLIWWSYLLRAHCEATLSPSQDISHFSNLIILKYLKEHLAWKKAWELATALPLKNPAMYFRDCSDKKMQSWDFLNIQVLASFWFLSWLLLCVLSLTGRTYENEYGIIRVDFFFWKCQKNTA